MKDFVDYSLSLFLFSCFLFIARRTTYVRKVQSDVEGSEDYRGNINRYRRHKGARAILDIKPPGSNLPPSGIPPRAIRLIEYVRRHLRRRRDATTPPPKFYIGPYMRSPYKHRFIQSGFYRSRQVNLYLENTAYLYSTRFVHSTPCILLFFIYIIRPYIHNIVLHTIRYDYYDLIGNYRDLTLVHQFTHRS